MPENRPFGVAALTLAGLLVLELVLLLVGISASSVVEKGLDLDHDGAPDWLGGMFGWLNAGRVPLLVLLMLLLGGFAAVGYALQSVVHAAVGSWLPAWIASAAAFVGTLPIARAGSRLTARIVPRDETYVAEQADFIGGTATVTVGPLDQGRPGRVRLRDRHGNWHFLIARAAAGQGPFAIGATVLLVEHQGGVYLAIAPDTELMTKTN